MSDVGERYGVRIRPPDGLTGDAVGELALMIAPITGQSANDLENDLATGAVVVAADLSLDEAKELVAVFASLGATPELVEPDTEPGGRALFEDEDAVDAAWRSVKTSSTSESPVTLPFDFVNLRAAAAAEDGPQTKSTQPFDPSMINAALAPGGGEMPTQPLDISTLADIMQPKQAADHYAKTQQIDASEVRAGVAQTQPFDGRKVREALAVRQETKELGDIPTQEFQREALLQPPPMVRDEERPVATTDPFDPATAPPDDMSKTQRFEVDASGRPIEGDAPTVPLELDASTRPLEVASEDAQTRPRHLDQLLQTREMGARQHDATRPQGMVGPTSAGAHTGATTARFERDAEDPLRHTGDMGSVQLGPLIFKLEAPPPQPTETGSVPTPIRLGDMTGEVPRVPPDSRAERRPSGVLPVFDLDEELKPIRADVYRLGGRGQNAAASRVVSITPPPTDELKTWARDQAGGEARSDAPAGAFQMVGADGVAGYMAPPRSKTPQRTEAPGGSHSAGTAGLLALVLPGMGQVYNGERDRAVWFAIGAVLILPWVWGVVDAVSVARRIAAGARRKPDAVVRDAAVRSHLVLVMAILFGVVVGAFLWQRISSRNAGPALDPAPIAAVLDAGVPDAEVADTGPTKAQIQAQVDALMTRGRQACGRGRYAECEEIMHAVLKVDRTYRPAHSLLVEANSKRRRREKQRKDTGVPNP